MSPEHWNRLAVIVGEAALLDAVCGTFIAPTIRTNKVIYIEGELVTLTGSHWRRSLAQGGL